MREENVMSEPLAVVALMRELVRKEITLALLDVEILKLLSVGPDGKPNAIPLQRAAINLEKDCSDLTVKFVHEAEKL
jgi:hypothetical protein